MQVILAEHASAPALHLFKIVLAAHIPHKDQALNGLDIGAGGDHVHRDCNAWVIVVSEIAEYPFRVLGGVGNLFAELVSLAELIPDNLNNIIGVAVSLGKDQGFGDFRPPREQRSEQIVPEGTNHRADLAGVDDVPVQLGGPIVYIFIQLLPSFFPRKPVAALDDLLHNMSAAFGSPESQ